MFLWFAGASVVAVWMVFRSPALDYRMVAFGAVLPVVEAAFGGPRVLHTLLAPVMVLVVVMLATRRRRLARRRWLGIPIGLFMHLVLDGSWNRSHLFWWPLFGASFGHGQIPEFTHGALGWVLELLGVACIVGLVRRFKLDEPARRAEFIRSGHFSRDLARGPEAGF